MGSAPRGRTDQQHQPNQFHQCTILSRLAGKRRMLAVVLFAQYGKAGGMGTLIGLIIMIGLILNGRCPLGSAPLERTDQQHQPDQLHQFAILPRLAGK